MMNILFKIVIALVCLSKTLDCLGTQNIENSRLHFFDIEILRYMAEDEVGNVLVSPASVKAVLAMLLAGAEGETASEIRNTLRLSPRKEDYVEEINLYLSTLKSQTSGALLDSSNAVFVANRLNVKKEYQQMLSYVFLSEIFSMNFHKPIVVANDINNWVKKKTNGLIPTVVDPVQINPSTDIMVINTLYFKGLWKHSFNSDQTKVGCFYTRGVCRNVPLMELQAELKYAYVEELRAHAVELPYEGDKYSMLILIPQDRDGSSRLLWDLPYMSVPRILELMDPNDIQLSLPRFSVDYTDDLVNALRKMRINTVFSTSANLSGIFENEISPQVNNIFHRTRIDVNEMGTVAAAVSGAMVVPLINSGVIQLRVDRPFLFFVRDNILGTTLFEGKIEEPEEIKVSLPGALRNSQNQHRMFFDYRPY